MNGVSRFFCASFFLSPKALLRTTRVALAAALVAALAAHSALALVRVLGKEVQTARPLTTRFVKRAPRLTKPLELKKRPRPRRRQVQRSMVSIKARAPREGAPSVTQGAQWAASLARPVAFVGRSVALETSGVEPEVLAEAVEGSKDPQHRIDMSLEMVDIEALDTGEYHAIVVQDPTDKTQVKGFFHLAICYSPSIGKDYHAATYICNEQAIPEVVKAVNNYTQIKTDIAGMYTMDYKELLKTPLIFLIARAYWTFRVTPAEASNLGKYFGTGGFAFVEDATWWLGGMCDVSLRQVLKDALATRGHVYQKDWVFEQLPNSHAVYHCFFDFDGPPCGDDGPYGAGSSGDRPFAPYRYLEGITLDGRLVTLYSMKALSTAWDWWRPGSPRGPARDNRRQLQFGVNIVVFALTQEGSITRRLMESVQ